MDDTNKSSYIERSRIHTLLDRGIKGKITFFSADIGWGKTAAVKLWSEEQNIPVHWYTIDEIKLFSALDKLSQLDIQDRLILVIDNFHCLNRTEAFEEYIEFIKRSPNQWSFILLSQSTLPDALKPYADIYQLELVSKEVLCFTEEETVTYFQKNGFSFDAYTLLKIRQAARGWAIALNTILFALMQSNGIYNEDVYLRAREELYLHFDRALFSSWSPRMRELIMKLSVLGEFTGELAMLATGQTDSMQLLNELCSKCGYITYTPSNTYTMSAFLVEYIERQRNKYLSKEEITEICERAGLWYETQSNKAKALEFYIKAKNFQKAVPLLEEAAQHHVGAADFYELEPYYMALTYEIVMKSPILCSGVCWMHSLNYRMEEAKLWYERLKSMRSTVLESQQRLLEEKIIYTSILLPNAGEIQLIGIFKSTAKLMLSGKFKMQDAAMTGNLPSLMRGGKDFSRWSNHAYTMRIVMKPILELLFGRHAIGVADVGVAEAMYEKNRLNISLVEVTKGIADVEKRGTPEIMFAGYTLMAKIMTANGQADAYKTIMENAKRKITQGNAPYLLENWHAAKARFELLSGEPALEWLYERAPDETAGFRTLDRYRYMTKAKVYIQNEMYAQAVSLLERLHPFYIDFKRPGDLTEDFIMQAIVFDRIGEDELSVQKLETALVMAQKHNFIRLFADEGEACYRLLIKYRKQKSSSVSDKFLNDVIEAAKQFALMYPKYLAVQKTIKSELTKSEFEVLQLLERSMTNAEIAEFLDVTLDTVKFHTKNIYSKLNVKGRAQAVSLAKEKKIIKG